MVAALSARPRADTLISMAAARTRMSSELIAIRNSDSRPGVDRIAPSQPRARALISSFAPRYRLIDRSSRNSACCCAVIVFIASR